MNHIAGFDIDGVIADFVSAFREEVRRQYGVDLTEDDIRGHDLYLALGVSTDDAKTLIDRTLAHPETGLVSGRCGRPC